MKPPITSKWPISRLSRHVRFHNGTDYKAVENPNGKYPVYGSGGIFTYANRYLHSGIGVLFGRKGTIDKPLFVEGKFWTVDTMYFVEPDTEVLLPKYLYYWALRFPFDYYSTNTAVPSMTQYDIGSEPIALPPLDEQQLIVDVLDHELSEIDGLIADQQHLLNLITERFNAELVSLCLPNDTPYVPLKRFAEVTLGKMKSPTNKGGMFLAPYMRAANIQPNGVFTYQSDTKKMWFTADELRYLDLRKNDVLVVEGGAGFGRSAILTD